MLDTDICIYLIKGNPTQVKTRLEQHAIGEVGISAITASELAFGVIKSGSARNKAALELFLLPFDIAPLDDSFIWRYGQVRHDLERRGMPIGSLDTQIAAHALALGCILVTNNTREFSRVDGLTLENWVEPQVHEPLPSSLTIR